MIAKNNLPHSCEICNKQILKGEDYIHRYGSRYFHFGCYYKKGGE